jgi:hypothetical protein
MDGPPPSPERVARNEAQRLAAKGCFRSRVWTLQYRALHKARVTASRARRLGNLARPGPCDQTRGQIASGTYDARIGNRTTSTFGSMVQHKPRSRSQYLHLHLVTPHKRIRP